MPEAGKEKMYRSNRGDSKIRLENIHTKIWDENVSGKLLPKAINNMHGWNVLCRHIKGWVFDNKLSRDSKDTYIDRILYYGNRVKRRGITRTYSIYKFNMKYSSQPKFTYNKLVPLDLIFLWMLQILKLCSLYIKDYPIKKHHYSHL